MSVRPRPWSSTTQSWASAPDENNETKNAIKNRMIEAKSRFTAHLKSGVETAASLARALLILDAFHLVVGRA